MYHVIRGKFDCPHCDEAIAILEAAGVPFEVTKMMNGSLLKEQQKVGHFTVPMVFKEGEFLGGCSDLKEHFAI